MKLLDVDKLEKFDAEEFKGINRQKELQKIRVEYLKSILNDTSEEVSKDYCSFCEYRNRGDTIYTHEYADSGYFVESHEINYCPICGRELKEE